MALSPARFAPALLLISAVALSADDLAPADPYWSLVHDQAVLDDLKLSATQHADWRAALDPLDLACFKLQNKSPSEAKPAFTKLLAETKAKLGKLLKPQQAQRLDQIVVRAQGPATLLRDDLAAKLKLSEKQRDDIREAISTARTGREQLQRDLRAATLETAEAEKQYAKFNETERDAVNAALTSDQKQKLARRVFLTAVRQAIRNSPRAALHETAKLLAPPHAP